jgi:hypothetical protein
MSFLNRVDSDKSKRWLVPLPSAVSLLLDCFDTERRYGRLCWRKVDRAFLRVLLRAYEKIEHWFEVIGRVLEDPAIVRENVYNMDETGVMLSILDSVKVLVSKADLRAYRVRASSERW